MKPSAKQAIAVVAGIAASDGPASAAFWVQPNVVLTLAGARSFCDGVFYSPSAADRNKWLAEIKRTLLVLEKRSPLRLKVARASKNPAGAALVGYDLITESGLANLPSQTKLLDKNFKLAQKSEKKILGELIEQLALNPDLAGLSEENLQHAAFGLLVGYPDIAIIAAAKFWQKEDDDLSQQKLGEQLADADIRGADYYDCPQPIYNYPRHLIGNPEIIAHEKLWSKILADFYTSDFHQKLAKSPAFQKQVAALAKY